MLFVSILYCTNTVKILVIVYILKCKTKFIVLDKPGL